MTVEKGHPTYRVTLRPTLAQLLGLCWGRIGYEHNQHKQGGLGAWGPLMR
jgi:hypothetical protein